MGFPRFYGHFAAAFGTFWLILVYWSVLTRSDIQIGLLVLIGFPALAAAYAAVRMALWESSTEEVADPGAVAAGGEEPPQRTPDDLP